MIEQRDITALVLAGGRGTRMGGVDKGLVPFGDTPLALHAARRIAPQVATVALNANRHLETYRAWGFPVWPDTEPGQPGPLAGFLAGLMHCSTPWLLTLPCDSPLFPADLAIRLAAAATEAGAPLAMAAAPDPDALEGGTAPLRTQPVFCLMHVRLQGELERFLRSGGRRVQQWSRRHGCAIATFDQPQDNPRAFANANTPGELQALHQPAPVSARPRR